MSVTIYKLALCCPGRGELHQYCCNDLKSYALAMPAVSTYHALSLVLCHKGCYEEQGIYFTNECG